MSTQRLALVSAMPREIESLVQGWKRVNTQNGGAGLRIFESERAVAACAGMGAARAGRATLALLDRYDVACVISVGWAGGLHPAFKGGQIVTPARVVDAQNGTSFATGIGSGLLVTTSSVAGVEEKVRLMAQFGADIVDMEATGVFGAAAEQQVPCYALKAVSDEYDARMPDMNRFHHDGRFMISRFLVHVAPRPWLWPAIAQMAKHASSSIGNLRVEIQRWIDAENPPHLSLVPHYDLDKI